MTYFKPHEILDTHKVLNQVPPLENHNLYQLDIPLQEALRREGGEWGIDRVHRFGAALATENILEAGRLANRYPPELTIFDRSGHRIDEVRFHPAYHELMSLAKEHEVHSIAWNPNSPSGGHVVHAALEYLLTQTEAGVCCPITMTYAVVPVIMQHQELRQSLLPKLLASDYDPRSLPAHNKTSITMGMAMTEKQGGSDIRANSTVAEHISADAYHLTGHKWFCSAPMSDAFLTLAKTSKGLTCFFVPRWLPDGTRNRFFIQRLKDKLGNRSNASAEIEYNKTWALRLGEDGRGVATIIEMVHHTRLDCSIAAIGLQRQALTQALHHCSHRRAFGKLLLEQPLMQNVLADLSIEYEAALSMGMRIARAYDEGGQSPESAIFARLGVAISKYWTNKRTAYFVNEAMECLGGAGYIEESMLPRLYREAPLNGIWEGSGNVICLDVLRAISKSPQSLDIYFHEIELAAGESSDLDRQVLQLKEIFKRREATPYNARFITEQMAICLQASLLIRFGDPAVRDGFLRSRLAGNHGHAYGTLDRQVDCLAIIERSWPR